MGQISACHPTYVYYARCHRFCRRFWASWQLQEKEKKLRLLNLIFSFENFFRRKITSFLCYTHAVEFAREKKRAIRFTLKRKIFCQITRSFLFRNGFFVFVRFTIYFKLPFGNDYVRNVYRRKETAAIVVRYFWLFSA